MGPFLRWILLLIVGTLLIIVLLNHNRNPTYRELVVQNQQASIIENEEPIETPLGPKSYAAVEENVFKPLGYKIRAKNVIPALDFITQPNCPQIFKDWLAGSEKQNEAAKPPEHIPPGLYLKYTLNNFTHIILAYMDDRSGTHSAIWTRQTLEHLLNQPVDQINNYANEGRNIYYAMKEYSGYVTGKPGIVIGSLSPWVESFPLRLNASHVTTIEYMKIEVKDYPKLDYKHPVEIAKEYEKHIEAYDWAASFSSLEHSGLGRFGDALDPIGDLKESLKTYCMLKKGGLFFLGFPMGYDTTHWNLHRIYGRIRLALMAAGFDLIDMFYEDKKKPILAKDFAKPVKEGDHKQFVVVLKKI